MSNLNNNTTQLEALLAKVNALPNAGGGANTSDATISADEVFAGEIAYGANGKIAGTFTIEEELTEQNDLISQISALVATKANPQGGNEDLDVIITELETKVATLNAELDSKASGGSGETSIETCTVHITSMQGCIADCVYTVYEDGIQVSKLLADSSGQTNYLQLNNVICGSSIFVIVGGIGMVGFNCHGGVEHISRGSVPSYLMFKAPTTAQTGNIDIYEND